MILLFTLFHENGTEFFQKFFVEKSYFSDIQIKTILNSSTRLLNIVKITSKYNKDVYLTKIFTITNLWFHIVKYKNYFYFFVTPMFSSASDSQSLIQRESSNLIKKIDELIKMCTSKEPFFELHQNNFFLQNTENLIIQLQS